MSVTRHRIASRLIWEAVNDLIAWQNSTIGEASHRVKSAYGKLGNAIQLLNKEEKE